jgi:hypothetical protein
MTDKEDFARMLLARHFVGEAFEDSLFHFDNQKREVACAWKIMRSQHHYSALVMGSMWKWRAIGIPLNLIDKSLEGDIDILIALRERTVKDGVGNFSPLYRCFELKTAKVKRTGQVTSLKDHQFHKTMGQLEKLCWIGCEQVFLLEAFIIEAGFSSEPIEGLPPRVREAISKKYDRIMRAEYGYVATAVEQLPGFDEEATGKAWPTTIIKPAPKREIGKAFRDIVDLIEAHVAAAGGPGYGITVTFCESCKKLTAVDRRGLYVCSNCQEPLL